MTDAMWELTKTQARMTPRDSAGMMLKARALKQVSERVDSFADRSKAVEAVREGCLDVIGMAQECSRPGVRTRRACARWFCANSTELRRAIGLADRSDLRGVRSAR